MEKKLNLGCGKDYKEGWVNLDCSKNIKTNIYCDLNKGKLPFKDNMFNEVYSNRCLEDINKEVLPEIINEIWRVLKPCGVFRIYSAFGRGIYDLHSPFRRTSLIPKTFDMFIEGTEHNKNWKEVYDIKASFAKRKVKVKLLFLHIWLPECFQYLSIFANIICDFKGEYIAKK